MKKPSKEISRKEILKLNFAEGDVPSLDPQELGLSGLGTTLGKWLFEGLTRLNLKGEYELAGAKEVKISPCQTRYTFTLRPNHYSDGTLVVAHDYERCWKRAIAPNSKCPKAHFFYYIKNAERAKRKEVSLDEVGVKAIDDQTLVVELNHPTPYFLELVSTTLFCPFKGEKEDVVFNGPYRVSKRKKGDYTDLEVNSFFWDRDHVLIKKINILMIEDVMTALSLYKQKELDWIGDPFCLLPPDVVASERAEGNLFRGEDVIFPFWIYLNTKHETLSSPLVRRALHLALNREEITNHLFMGNQPLFTPVPSSFGRGVDELNLVKAKELFKQGLDELGLTEKTFPPLKISSCNIVGFKRLVEYLKEKWEEAFDIRVELDIKDWNAFYADISQGTYQIGGCLVPCEYNDPVALLELLAHNNNFPGWDNQDYRKVLKSLKQECDAGVRTQLLSQAEVILKEEIPIIWLFNWVQYHGYRQDLKGICFDQQGYPDFRFAYFE